MSYFDDQEDIRLGLERAHMVWETLEFKQAKAYAKRGEPTLGDDGVLRGIFRARLFDALPHGGRGPMLESATGKTVVVIDHDLSERGGHHGWYLCEIRVGGMTRTRKGKRRVFEGMELLKSESAPEWRRIAITDLRLVAAGDQWGAVVELDDGTEVPVWAVNGNDGNPPWLGDEKEYERWYNLALEEAHRRGFFLEGELEAAD